MCHVLHIPLELREAIIMEFPDITRPVPNWIDSSGRLPRCLEGWSPYQKRKAVSPNQKTKEHRDGVSYCCLQLPKEKTHQIEVESSWGCTVMGWKATETNCITVNSNYRVRRMNAVKHWKKLSRDIVECPTLKIFKTHLNAALCNTK